MKLDPIVLGDGCVLEGSEVSRSRPNDNILVDGCSGVGKSTSLLLPTMGRMTHMNAIASYAKEADAYRMGNYMKSKGYDVLYLNVCHPEKSTISFDPLNYIKTATDIEGFSTAVVLSVLSKTVDSFWNTNSIQLLNSLIEAARMLDENAGMAKVLELFDMSADPESKIIGDKSLDQIFRCLSDQHPENIHSVREYRSWRLMPEKTATSVRATLKGAVNAVFTEDIRDLMREKEQLDFGKFSEGRNALFIITDAGEAWQDHYVNLFWYTCIKELKKAAELSPGGHLKRPVRLYFDDMACSSPIHNIEKSISLMRAYGVSFFIMLQSQTQLECVYGAEKASVIRQNCCVQAYFPGGADDKSCDLVAKRMNIPFEDVLYAEMGKVFVMVSGKKPDIIRRYDVFRSTEYKEYLSANNEMYSSER